MTIEEIKGSLEEGGIKWGSHQKVARGWFANFYNGVATVTYGC